MMDKRVEGIDLLRIISMLMIIVLHVLLHGGIMDNVLLNSWNACVAWLLYTVVHCGVNCFALISGYVGISSKYKISNIMYLWIQAAFYNVIFTVCIIFFRPGTITLGKILCAVLPVSSDAYWYFTAYFGLFFFIPVINYMMHKMDKKQLNRMVFLVIALFSVLSTVAGIAGSDIFRISNGYSLYWLLILYVIGAYLRKYQDNYMYSPIRLFSIFVICILSGWLCKWGIDSINRHMGVHFDNEILLRYNSPTMLLAAISLLLFTANIKMSSKIGKMIFKISGTTFGIYLIHDNPLIRENLLLNRFTQISKMPILGMVAVILIISVAIFVICFFIDSFRLKFFNILEVKERCKKLESRIRALEYFHNQ